MSCEHPDRRPAPSAVVDPKDRLPNWHLLADPNGPKEPPELPEPAVPTASWLELTAVWAAIGGASVVTMVALIVWAAQSLGWCS